MILRVLRPKKSIFKSPNTSSASTLSHCAPKTNVSASNSSSSPDASSFPCLNGKKLLISFPSVMITPAACMPYWVGISSISAAPSMISRAVLLSQNSLSRYSLHSFNVQSLPCSSFLGILSLICDAIEAYRRFTSFMSSPFVCAQYCAARTFA